MSLMNRLIINGIIFTILEGKVVYKRVFLTTAIWCSLTIGGFSSQEKISGYDLYSLVIHDLKGKGVSAQPIIKKNRVFTGCAANGIVVSKRDKSWKTINLRCKNNKSWTYTFRNKLVEPVENEKLNNISRLTKQSMSQKTKAVFILRTSKQKGDRIEGSDLILAEKQKLLSRGTFDDLKLVVGKKLKKSLKKGAILKASHLSPDWLVHKNQRITIENNVGGIYVAMEAVALSNGAKGDRILAKNISSKKIVEGFVKSEKKI